MCHWSTSISTQSNNNGQNPYSKQKEKQTHSFKLTRMQSMPAELGGHTKTPTPPLSYSYGAFSDSNLDQLQDRARLVSRAIYQKHVWGQGDSPADSLTCSGTRPEHRLQHPVHFNSGFYFYQTHKLFSLSLKYEHTLLWEEAVCIFPSVKKKKESPQRPNLSLW